MRVIIVGLSVCLSVTTLAATHLNFASPIWGVIRFLMAFQMYDLCGFADSKLLDFARAS